MMGSCVPLLSVGLALGVLVFGAEVVSAATTQPAEGNVVLRGAMGNCRLRFEQAKEGHVAFMGGSITEMNGYRPLVAAALQKRFPETRFTFTNAGIASTCSTTGAFRVATDVLGQGPVDLFLVEFAVNDDQDAGHSREVCIRGMEGILRHVRRHNPKADVAIVYFVNPEMLATLQAGKMPLTIGAHEEVARHYDVSSVHLARETARRISAGEMTWQQFGGTHPGPAGNALAAAMVGELLDKAWAQPPLARPQPHPAPAPLDKLCYQHGRFVPVTEAKLGPGWTVGTPDWAALKGSKRERFTKLAMLCADKPGSELTLGFTGTAVGAYVVAGPDAGRLEARVDDGPWTTVDLYHRFSAGLHYPRTVMFATDLKAGEHKLTLRVSDQTGSAGTAARLMQFVAN